MQPNLNDKIAQAKAAGYSDTEIQGYLQGAGFQPPAPSGQLRVSTPRMATAPTPTAPTQTRGRGGTLTSLISEGGALGGAAIGAAAGSAIPVIGTALGGIIGAGIGAFGGRLAENQVRDQRYGVTDALREGAWSAVLSGPLKGGKYVVTGGKALLAGKGAQQALKTAAKESTKFTIRGALGGKVTQASKDLAIKQFRINPTQLTNFAKDHGEDITEVIARYKINNADDIATKGINPLMSIFDDISDNVPAIPKSKLKTILQKDIDTLIKSPVLVNQQLGARLQEQADALLKTQGKTISGTAAKVLRQAFDDAVPYTTFGTPERNVTKKAADSIRRAIQNAADDAGLRSPDGKTLKDVGREVSKLLTLDEIVAKQENLGRGSLPVGIISSLGGVSGAITGAGAGGLGGAAFGGPIGALVGAGLTQAINSPTGRRLLAQAGQGTGRALTKSGTRVATNVPRQILNATIRGARGANLESIGSELFSQPTTLEDSLTQLQPTFTEAGQFTPEGALVGEQMPSATGIGRTGTTQRTTTAATQTATENPFTPELLIMAISADPKNAALYERIYKVYEDKYKAQTPAAAKPLTEAQQARKDIGDLTQEAINMLSMGSISTGFIPGRLEQAKAVFGAADPETLEFNTLISNLKATIAKNRGGTAFTPSEERMLDRYTPKVGDSMQQIQTKLALLQRQFGQPTNVTSLEEALISQVGGAE